MKLCFISICILSLFFISCAKSGPWTRDQTENQKKLGTLVGQVPLDQMEKFLDRHGLKARILSRDLEIYEVDRVAEAKILNEFPQALVSQDRAFTIHIPDDLKVVTLSPEEARRISRQQLAWVGLQEAQRKSLGEGVLVAVIDSGVNPDRWDLKPNMWINSDEIPNNGLDDDHNGYIDDIHGWNFADRNSALIEDIPHGTMSAAVIASTLTGIAPRAKIMGLRVSNSQGVSTDGVLLEAMAYAVEKKADIINLSMAGFGVSNGALKLFGLIAKSGVFVANSSGNAGTACDQNAYTSEISKLANVLTVAALNLPPEEIKIASYSNYGSCVKISAPSGEGEHLPLGQRGLVSAHPFSQTQFALYNGTSAAAPVVAGVAALTKALHPKWTGSQLADHLILKAKKVSSLKAYVKQGAVIKADQATK